MNKQWTQHIGDDQLVYGMPKHMVGVAGQSKQSSDAQTLELDEMDEGYYWTVQVGPKACDACLARVGVKFSEEPGPLHPNCQCKAIKHYKPPVKTEWTFDGSSLCSGGKCWPTVSGPHGKGRLPSGVYTISGNATPVPSNQTSYCDNKGNCWWVPLKPNFDAKGRSGFGIHPDGNVPGTLGCIGLTDDDTSDAYEAFKNAKGQKIRVY